MARPIRHRTHYDASADAVYAVLVDRDYLEARLREAGGTDAAVVELRVDGSTARVALRQGVPVAALPSMVRRFTGDDLIIDRTESWRREGTGHVADLDVRVRGLPGTIHGSQELTDAAGGGCELTVRAETSVPVPVVGGRIEGVVAEQVGQLLAYEGEFLRRRLAGQ